jgi:adenylate cyclase
VDKNVRDRVLQEGGEAHGTQITAAVVFIDIRDSTLLAKRLSASDFVTLLNEFYEAAVEAIQEHHGVVNKFMGDALLAFWANAFGSEHPCADAAAAALRIAARVEAMNPAWHQKYGCGLSLGIGLHYGPAIAGNIGSRDRKEFALMGDTVNTAKRLEELSKETHTRTNLSNEFQGELDGAFRPLYLGEYLLKGNTSPESVYTLDRQRMHPKAMPPMNHP